MRVRERRFITIVRDCVGCRLIRVLLQIVTHAWDHSVTIKPLLNKKVSSIDLQQNQEKLLVHVELDIILIFRFDVYWR